MPTLTEVVKPAAALQESPEVVAPDATASIPGLGDALVEAVLLRVLSELEPKIQGVLRDSLQAQWNAVLPHVLDDVKGALRDMVSDALISTRDTERS